MMSPTSLRAAETKPPGSVALGRSSELPFAPAPEGDFHHAMSRAIHGSSLRENSKRPGNDGTGSHGKDHSVGNRERSSRDRVEDRDEGRAGKTSNGHRAHHASDAKGDDVDSSKAVSGPEDADNDKTANADATAAANLLSLLAGSQSIPTDEQNPVTEDGLNDATDGDSGSQEDITCLDDSKESGTSEVMARMGKSLPSRNLANGIPGLLEPGAAQNSPDSSDQAGNGQTNALEAADNQTNGNINGVEKEGLAAPWKISDDPAGQNVAPDGMGAALNRQRMSLAAEKNEITEAGVQKLPHGAIGASFSVDVGKTVLPKADVDLGSDSKRDSAGEGSQFNGSQVSVTGQLDQVSGNEGRTGTTNAAAQAEKVGQLITREAVMIRQSGAGALAVSLKVDANTELSLQLSNHNGQIQASVRCERGSIEGLNAHWAQLQESLAKHNIHLMPLEDAGAGRDTFSQQSPNGGGANQFEQSRQQQQHARASKEPVFSLDAKPRTVPVRKTTARVASPQGWESWA